MSTSKETADIFRGCITNDRAIYDAIRAEGLAIAARIAAAVEFANREQARAGDPSPLISTDADTAAAIGVYLDELHEVATWELIGKHKTREGVPPRYRIDENAGIVTVLDNLTRYGFRFKKGDAFAKYTLSVIMPGQKNTTAEGMAEIDAATAEFCRWAAHRFPLEFGEGAPAE